MLDMCRTPELAALATMQPVTRLGVDAAILFSDIVIPLQAIGVDLEIKTGVGPVIEQPIRTADDVARLAPFDAEEGVPFVLETIRELTNDLQVPLIGFAGAPFTLASYLVEGGPSKTHVLTKTLMYSDPETWSALMTKLAVTTLDYLKAQIEAGASAIQLFDSWVGALSPAEYERYVLPHVTRILEGLVGAGAPRIHFGIVTGELLDVMASAGADVMGVDWRVPLDSARARITKDVALQGNLDPTLVFAPWEVIRERVVDVLERGGGMGHVFNLGHGVLPDTNPDVLARIVDLVHEWQPRD
jgi:uroporphyrinogen decarboxylase